MFGDILSGIIDFINSILKLGTGATIYGNQKKIRKLLISTMVIFLSCILTAAYIAWIAGYTFDFKFIRLIAAIPFVATLTAGVFFLVRLTKAYYKNWPKKKTKKDKTARSRFYQAITASITSLFFITLILTRPDAASNVLTVIGFIALSVPWILITWVALVAVLPIMAITLPAEISEKIKNLRPDWKHVRFFLAGSAALVTWIIFAAIAAVYLKVYYNLFALSFTLLVAIFLALAPFGWKIKTTKVWPKRLRLLVIWLVLVPLIIGFISPAVWVHLLGKDISYHLSFKMPRAEYEAQQARKWLAKEKDVKKAEEIKQVFNSTKKTPDTINLDSLQNKIDDVYKTFEKESIVKKTWKNTVGSAINGIKKIIPKKKSADPVEVVDETPPPTAQPALPSQRPCRFDSSAVEGCLLMASSQNGNTRHFLIEAGQVANTGIWANTGVSWSVQIISDNTHTKYYLWSDSGWEDMQELHTDYGQTISLKRTSSGFIKFKTGAEAVSLAVSINNFSIN